MVALWVSFASSAASYSAGAAAVTVTLSSTGTGDVSAMFGNVTSTWPPAGTVTSTGSASGPIGPARATSAVAPVSPFSSATSAVTVIGRLVSVCTGACALTARSGRRRDVVASRRTYVLGGVPVWTVASASIRRPRSTRPSSTDAAPPCADTSSRLTTSATLPVSVNVLTCTCFTIVTAAQVGPAVKRRVRSVRAGPVSARAVIAYAASVELGHAGGSSASPTGGPVAVAMATTTAVEANSTRRLAGPDPKFADGSSRRRRETPEETKRVHPRGSHRRELPLNPASSAATGQIYRCIALLPRLERCRGANSPGPDPFSGRSPIAHARAHRAVARR